jgi:hypothetical protein
VPRRRSRRGADRGRRRGGGQRARDGGHRACTRAVPASGDLSRTKATREASTGFRAGENEARSVARHRHRLLRHAAPPLSNRRFARDSQSPFKFHRSRLSASIFFTEIPVRRLLRSLSTPHGDFGEALDAALRA